MTRPLSVLLALLLAGVVPAQAEEMVVVQSTTSTQNSGLFEHVLPIFEAETGIDVRVVAVGTGQAIRNAQNGDGDVLLVHSRADEEAFVDEGHGLERHDLMYNDFVLVGPQSDPASVGGLNDAVLALRRIAEAGAAFVSRGDDSGTHKAELRLFDAGGIDPTGKSGSWYRETGSGMGATLNTAVEMDAYALSDRATWMSFGNKNGHAILVEGDPRLFNQYGIIAVDPARHPNVRAEPAARFVDWMLSPVGQGAIAGFRIDGEQLFFPNAKP
jgi:tungstate transport system substrate-binding protein